MCVCVCVCVLLHVTHDLYQQTMCVYVSTCTCPEKRETSLTANCHCDFITLVHRCHDVYPGLWFTRRQWRVLESHAAAEGFSG